MKRKQKKLGLVVSKAEIQAIINAGVHPMLQQTPFRNPHKTGAFDKDMLKKFLVDYSKMNKANRCLHNMQEYYESMYKFWSFLEKSLFYPGTSSGEVSGFDYKISFLQPGRSSGRF